MVWTLVGNADLFVFTLLMFDLAVLSYLPPLWEYTSGTFPCLPDAPLFSLYLGVMFSSPNAPGLDPSPLLIYPDSLFLSLFYSLYPGDQSASYSFYIASFSSGEMTCSTSFVFSLSGSSFESVGDLDASTWGGCGAWSLFSSDFSIVFTSSYSV